MPYANVSDSTVNQSKVKSQAAIKAESDNNTNYVLNGKKVTKAEFDASDEGYSIGGKKVTKAEFDAQKVKNATIEAENKKKAKGKAKVYVVNGKAATEQEYNTTVENNKKAADLKANPNKFVGPVNKTIVGTYQDENGKTITKEQYDAIDTKNKQIAEANKGARKKIYKVDGKVVTQEQYEATQKKNEAIKNKKVN